MFILALVQLAVFSTLLFWITHLNHCPLFVHYKIEPNKKCLTLKLLGISNWWHWTIYHRDQCNSLNISINQMVEMNSLSTVLKLLTVGGELLYRDLKILASSEAIWCVNSKLKSFHFYAGKFTGYPFCIIPGVNCSCVWRCWIRWGS